MAEDLNEKARSQLEALSWQVGLVVGLITLALGIVVVAHPNGSLDFVAILLGVMVLLGGIWQLVRALDHAAHNRALTAVVGLLFVIIGVVLLRHLSLTQKFIALFIGIVWIVQGVAELVSSAGPVKHARGWNIFFGIVSLAAGIVVIAVPESSLKVLAILVGIWFMVLGVITMIASMQLRRGIENARKLEAAGGLSAADVTSPAPDQPSTADAATPVPAGGGEAPAEGQPNAP